MWSIVIYNKRFRCNFEDREIEMYFTRYDIDPLNDIREEDIEKFYEKFGLKGELVLK